MGGEDERRSRLRQDIDSYIAQRKKSKGVLSTVFAPKSSIPQFRNKPSRHPGLSKGFGHARGPQASWIMPKSRARSSSSTSWKSWFSGRTSAWWEGFKSSVKQTVQHDLSRISSTGGIPMKTDQQEFMDFDEGGLTVVPIPDEVEPAHKEPQALKPSVAQSVPLNPLVSESSVLSEGSALPKSPKQGWFSRWFTKKQAVKQEKLLDEDFLFSATESQTQPHEADQELRDDFKELAKLCLKNLERMNKEQLSQYRSTPEFERFKELLRKHHVIK